MKSSLAKIDSQFEAHAQQIAAGPIVIAEAALPRDRVYGFTGLVPNAREKAESDFRNRVDSYRKARSELIRFLLELRIKPLAIVTEKAWNRLCDETGLFRLFPNNNGEVLVDLSLFDSLNRIAQYLVVATMLLVPTVFFLGIGIFVFAGGGFVETVVIIPIGFLVGGVIPFIVMGAEGHHIRLKTLWLRLLVRLTGRFPWRWQARVLIRPSNDTARARVVFPPAPENVVGILRKLRAAGKDICVAVDPAGFRIVDPFPSIFEQSIRIEHENALARARSRDPIIYLRSFGLVAIVAQYGDFPIEQAVVDRVIAAEMVF